MAAISGRPAAQTADASADITAGSGPVLVAVDLQNQSEALLIWAANMAAENASKLIITHIVHDPADSPGFYRNSESAASPDDPLETVARRMLADLLEKICPALPDDSPLHMAQIIFVRGLPRSRIAEVSRKYGARMIVLGHTKRSKLGKLLRSSLADHVIRKSHIPVVVI